MENTTRLLVLIIAAGAFTTGCRYHDWVELSSQRYIAALNTDQARYKGYKIAMLEVANESQASTDYQYTSTDYYFSYYVENNDTLMRFFKKALAKGFTSAGMTVYGVERIDKRFPCLFFTIRAISEVTLQLGLKVYVEGKDVFSQVYTVQMDQLPWDQRAAHGGSERKTYRLINQIVDRILADSSFAGLILGEEPPADAEPTVPPVTFPASGCNKDTDCKGDRICEDGACVSPETAAP